MKWMNTHLKSQGSPQRTWLNSKALLTNTSLNYTTFIFIHLADTFIQSNVQVRYNIKASVQEETLKKVLSTKSKKIK